VHSSFRQKLTAALLAFGPFGILVVALLDSLVFPCRPVSTFWC
jgi:hypothetical protein